MVKVTRRFGLPSGNGYDYLVIEADGETPSEAIAKIYTTYYTHLGITQVLGGASIDSLPERLVDLGTAVGTIEAILEDPNVPFNFLFPRPGGEE